MFFHCLQRLGILLRKVDRQLVTRRQHRIFLLPLTVDLDILADQLIDVTERRAVKIFFQKAVQPLVSLVFCNGNFNHASIIH